LSPLKISGKNAHELQFIIFSADSFAFFASGHGGPPDPNLLGTLLYSNNPGVAQAALASMDHLDPAVTPAEAEQAIATGGLHEKTRQVLQYCLAKSTAQKSSGSTGAH